MTSKDNALYLIKKGITFVGVYREKRTAIIFNETNISIIKFGGESPELTFDSEGESPELTFDFEGESLKLIFDSIDEAIKFVDMKYGLDNLFFY